MAASILAAAAGPVTEAIRGAIAGAVLGVATRPATGPTCAVGSAQVEPHPVPLQARHLVRPRVPNQGAVHQHRPFSTSSRRAGSGLDDSLAGESPICGNMTSPRRSGGDVPPVPGAPRPHLPAVQPLYTYGQEPGDAACVRCCRRQWRAGGPRIGHGLPSCSASPSSGWRGSPCTSRCCSPACRPAPTRRTPRPPNGARGAAGCCAARCMTRTPCPRGRGGACRAIRNGGRRARCRAGVVGRARAGVAGMRTRQSRRARWGGKRGTAAGRRGRMFGHTIGHTGSRDGRVDRFWAWSRLDAAHQPRASTRHRDTGIASLRRHVGDLVVAAAS